jgi:hypothetical protein
MLTPSNDDIILWADGTFCTRDQLSEFTDMSDDCEVIAVGTERHAKLWETYF